jgi:hypothetical protein
MPTQKINKQNIRRQHSKKKLVVRTKQNSLKNGLTALTGGMGGKASYWNENPIFEEINTENENRLILNNHFNSRNTQYNKYEQMLQNFLQYDKEKYMIDMEFTNNFYRNIYYDIDKKYEINLSGATPSWSHPENSRYKIDKVLGGLAHNNTTILFLSNIQSPEDKKVIKIFNMNDINVNEIIDYLSVEVTKIGGGSQLFGQYNYITFPDKDSFDMLNFNMKNYTSAEISTPDTHAYLSCRNIDPINDFINNLIIKYVANMPENKDKINVIDYNNLFVTNVITKDGVSNFRYCLIMDKVDGSLDQFFIKLVQENQQQYPYASPYNETNTKDIVRNSDRLYDYILQTEGMLSILKQPDYLFTHTDMKLENLFYKIINDKIVIYLGDFDKSSISLNGMRFYNDFTKNPKNSRIAPIDLVQGWCKNFLVDKDTTVDFRERKRYQNADGQHTYKISRMFAKDLESAEPEQLYMRYNNQPYYTSFDMISLLLSILHFRISAQKYSVSLIDLSNSYDKDNINNSYDKDNINKIYVIGLGCMTGRTFSTLCTLYESIKTHYNGNFGVLMASIIRQEPAVLENINFIHKYDNSVQPKTILKKLYITSNNKIGLSLPIVPLVFNQIAGKGITQFSINIDETIKYFLEHMKRLRPKISEERFGSKIYKSVSKLFTQLTQKTEASTANPQLSTESALVTASSIGQSQTPGAIQEPINIQAPVQEPISDIDTTDLLKFISKFTGYLNELHLKNKLNVLNIEYSGDYSHAKAIGAMKGMFSMSAPRYCIRTNKYSNIKYIYEWDYFKNENSDFLEYCKMLMAMDN